MHERMIILKELLSEEILDLESEEGGGVRVAWLLGTLVWLGMPFLPPLLPHPCVCI